jgi:hypothetical protein
VARIVDNGEADTIYLLERCFIMSVVIFST